VSPEYKLYYDSDGEEDYPDEGKPFRIARFDGDHKNDDFCRSPVLFTNPNGAPEDEVALVTLPVGEGIMMEWERPISTFVSLTISSVGRDPLTVLFSFFPPPIQCAKLLDSF